MKQATFPDETTETRNILTLMRFLSGIWYTTAFHFNSLGVNWPIFKVCQRAHPRRCLSTWTTITWRKYGKRFILRVLLVCWIHLNEIEMVILLFMLVFRDTFQNGLLVKLNNAYGWDIVEINQYQSLFRIYRSNVIGICNKPIHQLLLQTFSGCV